MVSWIDLVFEGRNLDFIVRSDRVKFWYYVKDVGVLLKGFKKCKDEIFVCVEISLKENMIKCSWRLIVLDFKL